MELSTIVAGTQLAHPIMNAAGPRCKTVEEIAELCKTPVAAVMVGSITVKPRQGNMGNVYWTDPQGRYSLNSLGLPNGGIPYYTLHLPEIANMVHESGKALFVSVAGFSAEEFAQLTEFAYDKGADFVELNLGCPNVWSEGEQKPIFSYDHHLVDEVLNEINTRFVDSFSVSIKLSPLPPHILRQVAEVVREHTDIVRAVTAINTVPNAFVWEMDKPVIDPGDGLAGLAGPAVKPIGLGVVRQLRPLLPDDIDIIGAGGIVNGLDAWDYVNAGATAVQIGTAFADYGPRIFAETLGQFVNILEAEEMFKV